MASTLASSVPPALRQGAQPSSPYTPNRLLSSNLSSPGYSFRQEEDAVIIELGSRYLRAGFEGEHSPQCILTFGPEDSRRVGDYRGWAPAGRRKDFDIERWGERHELWRMDLKDVDLGLVEDKLERAVREVYTKYLLTDAGSARLVLVLPSTFPHPLLSTVLGTLFNRWKYGSISLLPSPIMAAVAAGLRSALIVDIGWAETIATAIYEYREVVTQRTTRAMQTLLKELGRTLLAHHGEARGDKLAIDFELAEEFMARMIWCKQQATESEHAGGTADGPDAQLRVASTRELDSQEVEVDWPTDHSSELVKVPFGKFSQPLENVFLLPDTPLQQLDDHEHSLPMLVYESLLALPTDARGLCMSRIVFVGGGANIPGLSQRVLFEVDTLIKKYGWSATRGKKADERREKLKDIGQGQAKTVVVRFKDPLPPGKDYIEEKLQKQQAKEAPPIVQGELREVESLGAWSGASLLSSMKIKGLVEIERDRFLQHGLAGAQREGEVSVVSKRTTSYGAGLSKAAGDRTSWTLAGWG
jgi:actin-related protein